MSEAFDLAKKFYNHFMMKRNCWNTLKTIQRSSPLLFYDYWGRRSQQDYFCHIKAKASKVKNVS